jgi:hypothetical protein
MKRPDLLQQVVVGSAIVAALGYCCLFEIEMLSLVSRSCLPRRFAPLSPLCNADRVQLRCHSTIDFAVMHLSV